MSQTQLDRIAGTVLRIDERLRSVELRLAKDDGRAEVKERAGGRALAFLHALIAPVTSAGLAAGAVHFWGK